MNEINNKRDEELMARARKIVQKKHDLFINVIIYIAVNLFLIFIWFMTGEEFFWPIFSMLGWGVGIASMAIDVVRFINNKGYSDKVEREYQKLKRNSHLSD